MALHASEILQPLQLLNKEVEFGKKNWEKSMEFFTKRNNFAFFFVSNNITSEKIYKFRTFECLSESIICCIGEGKK